MQIFVEIFDILQKFSEIFEKSGNLLKICKIFEILENFENFKCMIL